MTGLAFIPKRRLSPYVAPALVKKRQESITGAEFLKMSVRVAAATWDVTETDIYSVKRTKNVVRARMFVMYFLRKYTCLSLIGIGKMLHRDHSTVIHAHRRLKNVMEGWEPEFMGQIMQAENETLQILGILN